jgi:hypothetical protein
MTQVNLEPPSDQTLEPRSLTTTNPGSGFSTRKAAQTLNRYFGEEAQFS